jgi:hypothetical protein
MTNAILSALLFIFVFGSILPLSHADIIPFYKVVAAENFEVQAKIDSRLYLPQGTVTAVLIYTTSAKIIYNINGESPSLVGGFTLDHLRAIILTKDQALLFRLTHDEPYPQRISVLYLDLYPF